MDVGLECIVLGWRLFFRTWLPSLSWGSHCPRGPTCCNRKAGAQNPWTGVTVSQSPLMGWCRVHTVSFHGWETLEAVRLPLVEKARVLRCFERVWKGLCLSLNSKCLESGAREPSLLRARGVYGYVLLGGASAVTSNAQHSEGPWASHDTVHS
jgi:hypothetical protein